MNLAITLVCHNRPEYLKRVIASIKENVYIGARLFVVRDNATPEVRAIIDQIDFMPKMVFDTSLGVNYANRYAYRMATLEGMSYVCAVEDDTILAPDCLQLVRWFMERNGAVLNCFSKSRDGSNPNSIIVANTFCPWVWAFKCDFFWDVLQPFWMRDRNGWDWSMLHAIRHLGIPTFEPVMSRSGNIGRDGGVHYTHEQFDQDFSGLVMSNGRHTDYRIGV